MKGFNVGMDESCSSAPVQVRHGTLEDVDAHKENRKRGRGGCIGLSWTRAFGGCSSFGDCRTQNLDIRG